MATIKEVALRAGVSVATVSYVLNDSRKVRPETEQRVLFAAKALGYFPNNAARSLVVGRSSIIGLIVPDIGNPFFPEIIKAFQEEAIVSGMETIVMNSNYDAQLTRNLIERLLSLQVPGVAFLTSQVDPAVKQALAQRNISAVYLDYGEPSRRISNIAVDYRRGMLQAVAHLTQLGHRRIGLIGGPANGVAAKRRESSFIEGASAAGLDTRTIYSDFSVQGGYFSCGKLLNGFDATAVIAANDLMAIGALHCAYDRRISVPGALSIIGFDDITFAQFTQPALTTVAVPRAEIGRRAFNCLRSLIAESSQDGQNYDIETNLIVRQTTGEAPPQ